MTAVASSAWACATKSDASKGAQGEQTKASGADATQGTA